MCVVVAKTRYGFRPRNHHRALDGLRRCKEDTRHGAPSNLKRIVIDRVTSSRARVFHARTRYNSLSSIRHKGIDATAWLTLQHHLSEASARWCKVNRRSGGGQNVLTYQQGPRKPAAGAEQIFRQRFNNEPSRRCIAITIYIAFGHAGSFGDGLTGCFDPALAPRSIRTGAEPILQAVINRCRSAPDDAPHALPSPSATSTT